VEWVKKNDGKKGRSKNLLKKGGEWKGVVSITYDVCKGERKEEDKTFQLTVPQRIVDGLPDRKTEDVTVQHRCFLHQVFHGGQYSSKFFLVRRYKIHILSFHEEGSNKQVRYIR